MMTGTGLKRIAIIGGGPAGLISAHEFLTTRDANGDLAFDKVVVFEQKGRVGGVWAWEEEADHVSERVIKDGEYWDAYKLHPRIEIPETMSDEHTYENPLETEPHGNEDQWHRSGVYRKLYTNVAKRFMRFSSIPYKDEEQSIIDPLISHETVIETLETFADDNKLKDHVRFHTQVQDVTKSGSRWTLTLRQYGSGKDKWYTEEFDAVVVASGHYSTPYIPNTPGLETREAGTYSHSKSFRGYEPLEGKTVLIVGTALSGIDIAQYIAKSSKIVLSRTPGKKELYPWVDKAVSSCEARPKIKSINGKTVTFEDSSELDVDHIIFATGYHWHYPFLNEKFIDVRPVEKYKIRTGGSHVAGLYYNLFAIEEPTLGFLGITIGAVKFPILEACAAALAGVWSGHKTLPEKEEQYAWAQKRLEQTSDTAQFQYYYFHGIKEHWFDPVIEKFAVPGRANPITEEDCYDQDRALAAAEKAFFGVKSDDALFRNLHI